MMNVTLKQLRYFEALVRHGHFGRAAEDCAISQPALSMQIKELEDVVGARLFERSGRRVAPTGFGEIFAERVREILRAIDELGELARAAQGSLSGPLRIGVIPTVAPYLLPGIVERLSSANGRLDIRIRETITPTLVRELAEGRLDAAIVALPVSEPAFAEVPLFTENFVLVRPAKDAGEPVPPPDALAEMKLLLLEEGHCFREQALSFCGTRAARPRELMDGSSLSTLVQMVGAGIGVTLIPDMAVPVETRSAAVAISRFPEPQPARTIGMIWRKTSPIAPQLREVARAVREARARE